MHIEAFDIAVIGAGHAGCEAAIAAARLGCRTALFTLNLDQLANLPCNPSIGGTAKAHMVFELDALGGVMPEVADANTIQSRMLNRGKGPAVQSLRVQCDRAGYHLDMKARIEREENLWLIQAEVVDIGLVDGAVAWVETALGVRYGAGAVIVATGTYLGGRIFVGDRVFPGGPDNAPPANRLAEALERLGLPLRRFKTGTPPRIDRRSVDFSQLERQPGEEPPLPFSVSALTGRTKGPRNIVECHLGYTNEETHQLIRENLERSAMYSGHIEGVGARYCPSIEDKIVRFADKTRHPLFVEPMGVDSGEIYLQGFSTSMPFELQIQMLRTIKGFEQARIMRPAYAIEYVCIDPLALRPSLEVRDIPGLYGAGQFNGTSGYEEAAAQGFMAGVNAARRHKGLPPVVLNRSESYIGLMIDDLTTKGCTEPYRMLTSRSEHRLLLRQDNTRTRLRHRAEEIGLVPDWRRQADAVYKKQLEAELNRLESTVLPPRRSAQCAACAKGNGAGIHRRASERAAAPPRAVLRGFGPGGHPPSPPAPGGCDAGRNRDTLRRIHPPTAGAGRQAGQNGKQLAYGHRLFGH
jgi:tRNA uridine 5-carboxymethylaminomethyl modification enzyme